LSTFVVDASVVAKWFFKEHDSPAAAALLEPANQLFAPELLWAELANAIWKRIRRNELPAIEAANIIESLRRIPIQYEPAGNLLPKAVDLAVADDRSVYDCLYLATAMKHECMLVTADERFFNALANTPVKKAVRLLGRSE
jgi:predicted nucleic acid-binding protein